jgi:hypothetical protein
MFSFWGYDTLFVTAETDSQEKIMSYTTAKSRMMCAANHEGQTVLINELDGRINSRCIARIRGWFIAQQVAPR